MRNSECASQIFEILHAADSFTKVTGSESKFNNLWNVYCIISLIFCMPSTIEPIITVAATRFSHISDVNSLVIYPPTSVRIESLIIREIEPNVHAHALCKLHSSVSVSIKCIFSNNNGTKLVAAVAIYPLQGFSPYLKRSDSSSAA